METDHDAPPAEAAAPAEADEFLQCRMSILGLDIITIERDYPEVFDKLKRRCVSCPCRAACVVDLKRDPNNRVWEGYCPNSQVLNALVTLTEVVNF
jgi:hypothetical protein